MEKLLGSDGFTAVEASNDQELNEYVGWGASPVAVGFTVFIYMIEVLVAFLQAFIFTMLTAVFIGQAFEGSHDDVDHHEEAIIV